MIKDIIESNEYKNVNEDKINALKNIIPNCFCKDGSLDIELLKKEFKKDLEFSKESFELNFLGKSYAKMIAGLDTETVIEPDVEHNLKQENENSENIYISGDNIDALKHLLKAYEGKIKCIYIDPPYNTGSDGFVYNDTFKFTTKNLIDKLDISEEEAERILNLTSSKSSSHSAWLTFMYPRLYLAKGLLREDGVIFISIDDNEQSNLKLLCDDIFGEENFVGNVVRATGTTTGQGTDSLGNSFDSLYIYSKSKIFELGGIELDEKDVLRYNLEDERGKFSILQLRRTGNEDRREDRPNMYYSVKAPDGSDIFPIGPGGYESRWRVGKEKCQYMQDNDLLYFKQDEGKWTVYYKYYLNGRTKRPSNIWNDIEGNKKATRDVKDLFGFKAFSNPKPVQFLERILSIANIGNGDIVVDFFGGSSTTAHSVMKLNAESKFNTKFIIVQLMENIDSKEEAFKNGYKTIDQIGQERIRRAAKKIRKETNANIDYGFKHYTLRETPKDLLNKLELFNPELISDNYELYKEYGIETILETWKLKDGYKFTTEVETIDCNNYDAYKCGECLYLINPNIAINNIQSLLDKYSKEENFVCDKLVLFGYSFKFNEIEMIKNNIKQVKNFKNIDVKVYTRY